MAYQRPKKTQAIGGLIISKRAYTVILSAMVTFLFITGVSWVILLSWMSVNHIEGGDALNKLETFIAGNFALLVGTLINPSRT